MRTPLVAGNWKMHGTRARARALAGAVVEGWEGRGEVEVVVCPPFPHLEVVARALGILDAPDASHGGGGGAPAPEGQASSGREERRPAVGLGAQNLSPYPEGAYTGEVSAGMLRDCGCGWVIVGHSERRSLLGETDADVLAKTRAALGAELTPIVCVGESLEEREAGRTEEVTGRQLGALVDALEGDALARVVIAYEPIWAIGTGRTASPEQAQEAHAFLRARIRDRHGTVADRVRILYGGSVKPENAPELFAMPDLDGGLVGGASLSAEQFLPVCRAARR